MRLLLLCAVMVGMGMAERSQAQGIVRESLAGPSSAGSGQAVVGNQPYNLLMGPVSLRMDASINTSFNDNINVAKTGRQSDFSIDPLVGLHLLWQVSEYNTLNFDLGIGYQAYLEHRQYNGLVVQSESASQLQYNIFVGDFKINVHDVFSYEQDPLSVGQLSNTAQFARFQNTAGLRVDWDLSDIIVSLTYDHANLWVFESAYEYLDNATDTISPQIAITVSPTITAGFNASFSDVRYDQDVQNDYTSVSVGPYVTTQLTENLTLHAGGGAYLADYNTGGLNGDNTSKNYTYYANVGVSHRINDVLNESLTTGRETIPGLTSNYTDRIYAQYGLSWQAMTNFSVGSALWWENLDDSDALNRETSNRYGASLNGVYTLNDHASISLGYQYVLKVADPSVLGYFQDLVTLGFHYQF